MTAITSSAAQAFLANMKTQPPRRGNLIFALDATASRERTWDNATQLTAQMFREVSTVGTLSMQLVYYRGPRDLGGECKASKWVDDPMALAPVMANIKCIGGKTQIERVLDHVSREALQRKINALVFVGDACEEGKDQLARGIVEVARLGIPAFIFQEGVEDVDAARRFKEIATLTKGAHLQFHPGMLAQLAELLRAVSVFAVGGLPALERLGSTASNLLLGQMGR